MTMAEYRVADLAHPRETERHEDCPECLALHADAVGMAKAMGAVTHTLTERRDGESHYVTVTREPATASPRPYRTDVHYLPTHKLPADPSASPIKVTDQLAPVTCVECIDGESYQRALAAVAEEYGDPLPEVTNPFAGWAARERLQVYPPPPADSDAAKIRAEVHRMQDRCTLCGQHVADPHAAACPIARRMARTSSLPGNDACAACLTPVGAAHAADCPLALL